MIDPQKTQGERVIRLSLMWVGLTGVAVLALGAAGGILAQWWWQPDLPPLPEAQDRLITTIQEVTISPSTATAELTKNHERSVVLLARAEQPQSPLVTGLVVTSDGIIATTSALPGGELVALDGEGRATSLTHVGEDAVYGITYFRAGRGVFSPFDVRDNDVPIGGTLTLLTRSAETLTARARAFLVEEYRLPEKGDPAGWQRVLGTAGLTDPLMTGSPLLDDEGRVAALLLAGSQGRLLPGVLLRRSLERVAGNSLDANAVAERGLGLDYVFAGGAESPRQFAVLVESVTARSVAAEKGLRVGDLITVINNKPVTWEEDIPAAFRAEIVTLSIRRGEDTLTVSLPTSPEASPAP